MLGLLAADDNFRGRTSGQDFLGRLIVMIGTKNQPDEVAQAMREINDLPERMLAFRLARRLGDGLQLANSSLAAADGQGILRPLSASASSIAQDPNADEMPRVEAMRFLSAANTWDDVLMSPILVKQWVFLTPRLRAEMITAMIARPNRTLTLVLALENLSVPPINLSVFQRKFMAIQPDESLRRRAAYFYGNNPQAPSRQNVVDQYAGAVQTPGAGEHGRALFLARCGDCHQSGDEGNIFAPVLKLSAGTSREKLLTKILDPNRNISTNNSAVIVVTRDGDTLSGNIMAQKSRSVTLCQPNGELRVLSRQSIETETSLGISAMPEGLEDGLNQQDLADLLEYLAPGIP